MGLVICFTAPHSYTGEDVVEFQCHGGPAVVSELFTEICRLGARPAGRGEFTERAYLNGRMDLCQAEAVAALIDAESQVGRRAAMKSLDGEFGKRIFSLAEALLNIRSQLEAELDFPEEEDIERVEHDHLFRSIDEAHTEVTNLLEQARSGLKLRSGYQVILIGKPNVGKSMLMNRLVGNEASIVTDIPGTTRDLVRDRMLFGSQLFDLVDTAGMRNGDKVNAIEYEGVRRAQKEIDKSDIALLVIDSKKGIECDDRELISSLNNQKAIVVLNKIDLLTDSPSDKNAIAEQIKVGSDFVALISATTGEGLDELRHLIASVACDTNVEDAFSAEQRHIDILEKCNTKIAFAHEAMSNDAGVEVVAEMLRQAHTLLGEITGEGTSEEVLDNIFGKFCIGK